MQTAVEEVLGIGIEKVKELFNFLPDPEIEVVAEGDAHPEPASEAYCRMHCLLVEYETDSLEWQWHPSVGKVYRCEEVIHQKWKDLFAGKSNPQYFPFTLHLDWEIAQWAVKENISQHSLNCLLQVPEVKEQLGLSFSNVHSMLQQVDAIPEQSGPWYTKQLSFNDRPDEHFYIHHCNPIEAIKALWGDPVSANDLVYKLAKLFQGKIFSEMWTAGFWNAVQVHEVLLKLV
ncbi:hypothetical protein GYMLUDRAFT_171155 [Collybiopsis luxurians FD-317 M1]|uniref:Uncharacterized protein n=1 Tax=Collybiopsis luxurians FD-317 M1 TaxID=944289 RepID=A0A0D0CS03_9AGAR|nr:hypothetical protein GYMLUDRAFT_171155 [Collybiopsis luxurians FD-317 M1]